MKFSKCLLLVKCALKKKNIEKSFIYCSFVLFQADKLYRSIVAEQLIRNNSFKLYADMHQLVRVLHKITYNYVS